VRNGFLVIRLVRCADGRIPAAGAQPRQTKTRQGVKQSPLVGDETDGAHRVPVLRRRLPASRRRSRRAPRPATRSGHSSGTRRPPRSRRPSPRSCARPPPWSPDAHELVGPMVHVGAAPRARHPVRRPASPTSPSPTSRRSTSAWPGKRAAAFDIAAFEAADQDLRTLGVGTLRGRDGGAPHSGLTLGGSARGASPLSVFADCLLDDDRGRNGGVVVGAPISASAIAAPASGTSLFLSLVIQTCPMAATATATTPRSQRAHPGRGRLWRRTR